MAPAKKSANPRKPTTSKALVPISEREAPPERYEQGNAYIEPLLNDAQRNMIANVTPAWAIKVREGRGGNYRYVPHGYVTDTLNKAFGFNWDFVLVPMKGDGTMYEIQTEEVDVYVKGKKDHTETVRHLAVSGYIEVRVYDKTHKMWHTLKKSGFGSQLWLKGAELGDGLKGATSDCLKVCAQRLGIALDLYYNEDEAIAKLNAKNAERERNDQVEKLLHQPPNTFVVLLSRAKSEYDVDLPEIETLAAAKAAALMNMTAGEVAALWKKIQDAHPQTVEGEVSE